MTDDDRTDDLARGPLCQHIYPNGLRCYALAGDERHWLVEGRPSPHRHLFEQKCSHTSLRRSASATNGHSADEVAGMIVACEQAAKHYAAMAVVSSNSTSKSVYARFAGQLRAAARVLAGLGGRGQVRDQAAQEIEP